MQNRCERHDWDQVKREVNKPKISVWQYLVQHKSRGYVSTQGYYRSADRCLECLNGEFKMLRRLDFTKEIIDEDQVVKWEMLGVRR